MAARPGMSSSLLLPAEKRTLMSTTGTSRVSIKSTPVPSWVLQARIFSGRLAIWLSSRRCKVFKLEDTGSSACAAAFRVRLTISADSAVRRREERVGVGLRSVIFFLRPWQVNGAVAVFSEEGAGQTLNIGRSQCVQVLGLRV